MTNQLPTPAEINRDAAKAFAVEILRFDKRVEIAEYRAIDGDPADRDLMNALHAEYTAFLLGCGVPVANVLLAALTGLDAANAEIARLTEEKQRLFSQLLDASIPPLPANHPMFNPANKETAL